MNPLTNVRNLNKINERELNFGAAGDDRRSWHGKYKDSAWIFVGGLPYDLSEGDVISVFSQYGEIVNINLIRDKKTGKSRGFAFICYEDQRSTVLAVDNFNGTKVLGRILRVDHVENYRVPKDRDDVDDETRRLWMEGCAPEIAEPKTDVPDTTPIQKQEIPATSIGTISDIRSNSAEKRRGKSKRDEDHSDTSSGSDRSKKRRRDGKDRSKKVRTEESRRKRTDEKEKRDRSKDDYRPEKDRSRKYKDEKSSSHKADEKRSHKHKEKRRHSDEDDRSDKKRHRK